MKCLKCKTTLNVSPHNELTGYESYKCPSCSSLYDIQDLAIKEKLNKPLFPWKFMDKHFEDLLSKKHTNIPTGFGISLFLLKILEKNSSWKAVVEFDIQKSIFPDSILSQIKTLKEIDSLEENLIFYQINKEKIKSTTNKESVLFIGYHLSSFK